MAHIETLADVHILEVQVNRADKLNALSPEMYKDLASALARLNVRRPRTSSMTSKP